MMSEEDDVDVPFVAALIHVCDDLLISLGVAQDLSERKDLLRRHIKNYSEEHFIIPEFIPGLQWLNVAAPLSVKSDLQGRVTVIDFFTYCCINCMHVLPFLEEVEAKYPSSDGRVAVVGVHCGKFSTEKVSSNVKSAISRYNITHPVVNDDGAHLWKELFISFWPTILVLGPSSEILFVFIGEDNLDKLLFYVDTSIEYFSEQNLLVSRAFPVVPDTCVQAQENKLSFPEKICCFNDGLIISDTGNNRVLVTNFAGEIKCIIGCGKQGNSDGSFGSACFDKPAGVAFKEPSTLFIADRGNHAIKKADLIKREVTTILGNNCRGSDLIGGKLGLRQPISSPWDLLLCGTAEESIENILFIAMAGSHQIWGYFLEDGVWGKKRYPSQTGICLAGSGKEENRNTSYPLKAGFAQPSGLALIKHNEELALVIADSESSSVRKLSLKDGRVAGIVGGAIDPLNLFSFGDVDGTGTEAKLQHPLGVASSSGDIYVADTYNHKIKKIVLSGKRYTIQTYAGTGIAGNSSGNRIHSQFNEPGGLSVSLNAKNIYIADTNNHCIKCINVASEEVSEVPIIFNDIYSQRSEKQHKELKTDSVEIIVPSTKAYLVNLHVKLRLEGDQSLNKDAPNIITLTSDCENVKIVETENKLEDDCVVPFKVVSPVEGSDTSVSFTASFFLCSGSLCSHKTVKKEIYLIPHKEVEDDITTVILEIP